MSYALRERESVQHAVKRIAYEQIAKGVDEIRNRGIDPDETVHQVRKRCKKIRGLLRLARPGFEGTYRRENALFRDTARGLAPVRDAHVLVTTLEKLLADGAAGLDPDACVPVAELLHERRAALAGSTDDLETRLADALARLHAGRERIAAWSLDPGGFDVIAAGMVRTYRRGRRAMAASARDTSVECFHEWRKRAKYHWYHMRLIRPLWKPVLSGYAGESDALADRLGDEHDLGILRRTLAGHRAELPERAIELLFRAIDRRRMALRTDAFARGRRIYSERPRDLARRLSGYWDAWQDDAQA